MSLMNALVRWYIQKWDQELDDITNKPGLVQHRQLQKIAKSQIVLTLHPSLEGKSIDQFLADRKISTYDDHAEAIQQLMSDGKVKCKYYAQSSGTTSGTKKLIPTPEAFVKCNLLRGSWYQLHTLYKHDQSMSVFRQKNLLIGGSLYEQNRDYTIGDVSGIMISRIPSFFRPWYVPTIREAVQPDWQQKLETTATKASKENNVALIGGTPTWVLSTLRSILAKSEKKSLATLWPNLKAYIHGGVDFKPYRSQMDALMEGANLRYIEVYNASEGFFAYQDRPEEEGMLLMLASGIYYEFVEEAAYRRGEINLIPITQVKLERNYIMVISTIAGLIRYVQGDIVKFLTNRPYRIKVVSRIETYINAFGEDLLLSQVQEALSKTNNLHRASISQFHVAPYYISLESKGRHDWFIEWEQRPVDMDRYALDLDLALQEANPNYTQKRGGDIALESLKIFDLPKGISAQYFLKHGKLGGQSKLQRLRNNRKIADRLMIMLSQQGEVASHEILI